MGVTWQKPEYNTMQQMTEVLLHTVLFSAFRLTHLLLHISVILSRTPQAFLILTLYPSCNFCENGCLSSRSPLDLCNFRS